MNKKIVAPVRAQGIFLSLVLALFAAGCSGAASQNTPTAAEAPQAALAAPTAAVAPTPTRQASSAAPTSPPDPAPTKPAAAPAAIEVTYTTPAQAEGPYYPVEKPAERDSDLTVVSGSAGQPAGQRLLLRGKVYDQSGQPLAGVLVEIWQTDNNGVYLHPNDPGTNNRDKNFQFYGEALTAADGSYSFLTIIPGLYEPRPRHIHVKVKQDGRELLTTQFYFPEDVLQSADGIFSSAGDDANALLVALQPGSDALGELLVGTRDIVLGE